MKNLFTFIVALFMATSVYAQGTYAVANGEQFTPDYKISKVPNITVYYMANAGNVFNAGKKTANWADSDFNYYASIKTGDAANYDGKSEPTGAYLKFEPKNDGTIIVGIQIDKFKELCLVGSDFARITDYTYNLPSAAGQVSQTLGTNNKTADTKVDNCLTIKSNGTVTLNVKAGNTYYLMALGSKIGFFGFKYLVNEKVTITDAGFATHASKFAVDYSNRTDGLEAYSVSYNSSSKELTYAKINGVVEAGKAVILKGKGNYILEASSKTATVTETGLETSDGTKTGATNIYCLANKNNVVGFYQVAPTVKIPANKAYLEINAANSAKYYSIGIGGNTTGIQAIQQNSVKADGIMYSLSGQRVGKDYKGIVICNGKKMIKK